MKDAGNEGGKRFRFEKRRRAAGILEDVMRDKDVAWNGRSSRASAASVALDLHRQCQSYLAYRRQTVRSYQQRDYEIDSRFHEGGVKRCQQALGGSR